MFLSDLFKHPHMIINSSYSSYQENTRAGLANRELCSSPFFMPFTHKFPSVSFTRMYIIDYVAWVPTTGRWTRVQVAESERPKPWIHLESAMEVVHCFYM